MTFPVPSVAGVFLSLSGRLKTAITDGSAAHYLLGRTPTRLRNHLGFHAAIAEMVDALLERAVLPYQTTSTLSSDTLSNISEKQFSGTRNPPVQVRAAVDLPPIIATAEDRAKLGTEKRYGSLEFWMNMVDGINDLFTSMGEFYVDSHITIYPSCIAPLQWEGGEVSYGFEDTADSQWSNARSGEWPSGWPDRSPYIPMAFDVPYSNEYTYMPSQSMLMEIPFDFVGDAGGWALPWYSAYFWVPFIEDIQFSDRSLLYAVTEERPGPIHLCQAADRYFYFAPNSVGYHRHTARPNIDLLRIYQTLLGCFWANWASMTLRVMVPHVKETVIRTWTISLADGSLSEPIDVRPADGNKTCSEYHLDNEARWELSADPSGDRDLSYGCGIDLVYVVPFGFYDPTRPGYPFLDPFALSEEETQDIEDAMEENRRDKAEAESSLANLINEIAEADAELRSLVRENLERELSSSPSPHWQEGVLVEDLPDHRVYRHSVYAVASGTLSARDVDFPYNRSQVDGGYVWNLDVEGVVPALVDLAMANQGNWWFHGRDRVLRSLTTSASVSFDGGDIDEVAYNRFLLDRERDRLESRIRRCQETEEYGIPVSIGGRLLDLLREERCTPRDFVLDGCDEDSADVARQIALRMQEYGTLEGWEPPPPQTGSVEVSVTAKRTAPVIGSEGGCPLRIFLGSATVGGGEEGVSPWPAESVIDGGYVAKESIAFGLHMDDKAKGAKVKEGEYFDGYYIGSDAYPEDQYPEDTYRRLCLAGPAWDVSSTVPADILDDRLRDVVNRNHDMPRRAQLAVSKGCFSRLLFVRPDVSRDSPSYEWSYSDVHAWYHPDRGPDRSPGSPYQDLGSGFYPYRITHSSNATEADWVSFEEGDSYLEGFHVYLYYTWQLLLVKFDTGFSDSTSLDISRHLAVRAEWNWKSMPVQ